MNRAEFIALLEKQGVEATRHKLQSGAYGPDKLTVVSEWLGEQERQSSEAARSRKEASSRETIDIARSAKNAAWAAAISAMIAVPIAIASLLISIFHPFGK